MKQRTLILFLLLSFSCVINAAVKLPKMISDGMVLQRDEVVNLWGTADAGEAFKVVFRKKKYDVTADADGNWKMQLPAQKAGGPFTLQIGDKTVENVMVGDVWLCSGQSNIDLMIYRVADLYREEVENDRVDAVRLLKVENVTDVHGVHEEVPTSGWHVLEPEFARNFSSLSYFLAKQMYEKTGVPQGVIACSWGGTPIQSWIPAEHSAWQANRRQELLLAQNDEYVKSLNHTGMLYNKWWGGLMYASDPGKLEGWEKAELDESLWKSVDVKTERWAVPGCGSWWLRQHIIVDKAHAGKKALLRCGTIVDADSTWVNGVCVGTTGYQYPPRRYTIPEGLLKEGDNVICVRITTGGAMPEFVFPKPYCLDFDFFNKGGVDKSLTATEYVPGEKIYDKIELSTTWKMRRGAILQRRQGFGISMQNIASACYNAMLYPLHNYTIKGAVWYQGESNVDEPHNYLQLLVSLMTDWRRLFGKADLPFYVVQLPNYMDSGIMPEESGWVSLREAQRLATTDVENATLVTGLGLGERHDIHPQRKKEMAARVMNEILGNGAPKLTLNTEQGNNGAFITTSNGEAVISFDKALTEGTVGGFELSADGKKFFNATAVAKGNTVTVSCAEVKAPKAVRYAWHNSPDNANLQGTDGMPVCTFELK